MQVASADHIALECDLGDALAEEQLYLLYQPTFHLQSQARSLASLRQFPVDALKLDRSFISGISSSTEAAALMHTVVGLGKALGLETLGEGLEEQAQLEQLQRDDCDSGQRFLFARPLDADAVTGFL